MHQDGFNMNGNLICVNMCKVLVLGSSVCAAANGLIFIIKMKVAYIY